VSFRYLWKHRQRSKFLSKKWIKAWAKRAVRLPSLVMLLVRRTSLYLRGATLGDLTVVSPCILNGTPKHLKIGSMSSIGRVFMHLHADITIGNYVAINDGVTLLTASHRIDSPDWQQFVKPIVVEDFAWIATGVIILPGIRIGKGAVVGAGAVVSKDVPDYGIVVGNPAMLLNKKRSINLTYNPVYNVACYEAWLGH
jgi:serine acetyltransferase